MGLPFESRPHVSAMHMQTFSVKSCSKSELNVVIPARILFYLRNVDCANLLWKSRQQIAMKDPTECLTLCNDLFILLAKLDLVEPLHGDSISKRKPYAMYQAKPKTIIL